ncbi:uncharacterized protein [Misgurnus anguillicaudatus]|uniref:uncharacterized protein isoform X1 n=1 Tax=Misgurnus anguillicaudatus TaxID=75329 RepID=UPI003CCF2867
MNPRENGIGEDNVIAWCLEDALKVALRGAFEVAMEIAVKETSKLMAQVLQDVRGQIHETQQENINLKLRLQQIHAEQDNPKPLTADPNQSSTNSDPEREFKTEIIEQHTEPSDQDLSSCQSVFTQVLVKNVKPEPEDPVLDGSSGSDARPDCFDQMSNEECGLDKISMAQSKLFCRFDSEQLHSETGSLDEAASLGNSENTLSFDGGLSSLSTPFDGLHQSEDETSIPQTLQNCKDQLGTNVQSSLYVCIFCGRSYYSESNLHNHHIRYHNTILKTVVTDTHETRPRKKRLEVFAPGSSPYHCSVCNQNFSCQQSLRTHTQIHTESHDVPASIILPLDVHLQQTSPSSSCPVEYSPCCEVYAVPWHKMPSDLMLAISKKKRPKPKERRELVRIVIDDVFRKERGRPGRAKLREIAKRIVAQYPCSFQDRDLQENVIGTGYDTLFIQLENRVENLRRPSTSRSAKRPANDENASRKRSTPSDGYGCVDWQPDIELTSELETKKNELKSAFKTKDLQDSSVRKLMAETYCIQRATINKGSTVNTVLEEWPYLFEADHLFDHTCTLLGFSVQNRLAEELSRKGKTIIDFLYSKGMKMQLVEEPIQLITAIAIFFKENPDYLFYQNEQQDSTSAGLPSIPSTPCILIMGDGLFKIAVDHEIVNDHITSPIVALSYTFSLFYVLNIKYPKEMALTLEFIQRVFLGINPERGSKAQMKGTKRLHIPQRLLKLLYELNNFENP